MSASKEFRKCFTHANLRRIYNDKVKTSGAIGLDRNRPVHLESRLDAEIDLIVKKVFEGSYRFTAYKEKLILKGSDSLPRQISIPTARDRIVLRALCECLSSVYPAAKLSLPQEVISELKSMLDSGDYAEYAKIDLKNFYPSIPHALIKSTLWKKVRKVEIRNLIQAAIKTPTVPESRGRKDTPSPIVGVPQGLAISNLLAEIALQEVDEKFRIRGDIWYKRYVDDILILAPEGKAKAIADELISVLRSNGLSPHGFDKDSKSKFAPLDESFNFLGYQIENGQIAIRNESILRFESSIAKIFTAYRHRIAVATSPEDMQRARAYCEWKVNIRITGCYFSKKRRGWVSYYSQISSTAQLRAVNHTVQNLVKRFGLDGDIKIKSLIKTFYEMRRGGPVENSYIPNLDNQTVDEKRRLLAIWIGDKAYTLPDFLVEKQFLIKVAKAVHDLEEDIGRIS